MNGENVMSCARLADELDKLGFRCQVLESEIVRLEPGAVVFGRAATVEFGPAGLGDSERPYDEMISFIDGLQPGEFVVIAAHGASQSALWGELFSAAAIGRGVTGILCDGFLRDTAAIATLGFSAWSRGSRPIDYRGRLRVIASRERVVCAGVVIMPGDYVFADNDGVVVAPAQVWEHLRDKTMQRALTESSVLKALLRGKTLRDVWNRYKVL